MIRLSEAIAKVKFMDEVLVVHVEEALRLMQSSLLKLERDTITLDDSGVVEDENMREENEEDRVDGREEGGRGHGKTTS